MIPIRFGTPERQLFGLYQPAPSSAERLECVVLCNPFGQEAIRCHRLFKVLADRLSRAGFHVLRFDYFATGDSAGDDHEGDIDGWVSDVLLANEEIICRSGCLRVSWFGLRLGASLAMLAAAKTSKPPTRLILWDPVVNGAGYLDELASAHIEAFRQGYGARWEIEDKLREKALQETHSEALGFPLSPLLKKQLATISSASFTRLRVAHVNLFGGKNSGSTAALHQYLNENGVSASTTLIETEILWASNEAMSSAIVPSDALQLIMATFQERK